jgi:hypothetical protein
MKKYALNMMALITMLVLVATVRLVYLHVDAWNTHHRVDPVILTIASSSYFFGCLVMIARTRSGPWSILGAGLLATMAADVVLYFYLLASNQRWVLPFHNEWVQTARALVTVGGPYVFIGLILECYQWWQEYHDRKVAQTT